MYNKPEKSENKISGKGKLKRKSFLSNFSSLLECLSAKGTFIFS